MYTSSFTVSRMANKGSVFLLVRRAGGDITCGGQVCGSVSYVQEGAQSETGEIGLGLLGGKVAEIALGKVFGWIGRVLGRTGATAGASAASKVLTGFSPAQAAMIRRSLAALEAAGENTGRARELVHFDAPPEYFAMTVERDGIALTDRAFSSQAELTDSIRHELGHLEQKAKGEIDQVFPGRAAELEKGVDERLK